MAKKKQELQFLQLPLPQGQKLYRILRLSWNGLATDEYDSNGLITADNVDTSDLPYLNVPPKAMKLVFDINRALFKNPSQSGSNRSKDLEYNRICVQNMYKKINPVGAIGFDKILVVFYTLKEPRAEETNRLYMMFLMTSVLSTTGMIDKCLAVSCRTDDFESFRSCPLFDMRNADEYGFLLNKTGKRRILMFPDKRTILLDSESGTSGIIDILNKDSSRVSSGYKTFKVSHWYGDVTDNYGEEKDSVCPLIQATVQLSIDTGDGTPEFQVVTGSQHYPPIKYAETYNNRLYGVSGSYVYISTQGDFTNWITDNDDDFSTQNAWSELCFSTQASTNDFIGITSFDNHVTLFKNDYIHRVNNTDNPFVIGSLFDKGALNQRCICSADGILYFMSQKAIYAYTGSKIQILDTALDTYKYVDGALGSDGENLWVYCVNRKKSDTKKEITALYVYNFATGTWSQRRIPHVKISDDITEHISDTEITSGHVEVDKQIEIFQFVRNLDGLYFVTTDGMIYDTNSMTYDFDSTEDMELGDNSNGNYGLDEWAIETDIMTVLAGNSAGYRTLSIKHLARINMMVDLKKGTHIEAYTLFDNEVFDPEKSIKVYDKTADKDCKDVIRVIVRPSACYGYRLYIRGKGYAKLGMCELYLRAGGDKLVTGTEDTR